MNLKKLLIHKEKAFLLVFFLLLFFFAIARPFDYQLAHDKPYGYYASDAFIHYIWAESLKDSGGWRHYPSYFALNYNDTIAFNPPLLYQVSVILSNFSHIPLWDTILFLTIFSVIAAILAIFLLIKKHFSDTIAYLSLPLTAFMFIGLHYTLFSWGIWIYAVASVFLVAMFYLIDEPLAVILLLVAMIHTHTSEFIFAVGFIGVYVLFKRFKNIKEQAINITIAVTLSSYFLWIFYNTWMQVTPYQFAVETAKDYTGIIVMTFGDFGWIFGVLIILGIFTVLINKKMNVATLAGLYMLLVGYASLIGFGLRAFQTRFFWPIYLAVFLGFILFTILPYIEKYKQFVPFISIALFLLLIIPQAPKAYQGLLLDQRWDELQWTKSLENQTEKHLFIYSDDIQQAAMLWMTKKTPYYIGPDQLKQWVLSNLSRTAEVRILGDSKSHYAYWDGFNIKHHWDDKDFTENPIVDICDFDYVHLSALNPNTPMITDVHNFLLNKFLLGGNQLVYNKDGIAVIKNLNKGGECYEEGIF